MFFPQIAPRDRFGLLNHTGVGQDERFVLPSFAAQIARIEAGLVPPKLHVRNLGIERDFLDVRDVIDAYLLILAGAQGLPLRAVFNVASGQPRRISDLLNVMVGCTRPFDVEIDPARFRPAEYLERSAMCNAASTFRLNPQILS